MIPRHETHSDKVDIWAQLAAPLPPGAIQWRQQGRPITRDGRHFSRFVAYIDSQFVQERFDSVVPGEWDSTLEQLPNAVSMDGEEDAEPFAFKCRVQVLGVIREDVGTGKDYKTAATDAFKRASVRFGIGRELYAMEPNFVQMDGDGKYAKPVEDPGVAYARRHGKAANAQPAYRDALPARREEAPAPSSAEPEPASGPLASEEPTCPKCCGRVWDNRLTKRNPKAPDYKCRDRSCDGVIWPPKGTKQTPARDEETERGLDMEEVPF